MLNIEQTILSQYANSPSLCTIIDGQNQALDPTALIDQWYALVWNVQTAQGYGLDVWGRIVGVSRVLTISSETYLGFAEANDLTEEGFNTAPWYSGVNATTNFALSDEGYRQLIYAKALANITDCSILALNLIAMTLFAGQGDVWVQDNGGMTMTYVFDFVPTDVQISIIQNSGVLPRPAGVGVSYSIKSAS
ncbi:DUF2612 domain-containing protein [Acetobacter sp. TBRC 12305]|uniref:DUF2612 domain-containing protein n=1 Tax=Acetobacter garciniae TaxID=2817435 RepID=A0A939HJ10_9PROT|nr:DUF2612 domain-containing protein [Acetobacter garciniae]MBO1325325.1 DUF2612 domain-containing protein [Acetobacter garciniae]MBX0345503.1 DUF2612 domain-containing protein [Acetobacter garciniae]